MSDAKTFLEAPLAPVVILVRPQLGENIGTAARAMRNGRLTELRLVAPKFGWPNPDAIKPAKGGAVLLENVKVYETTAEAIADLNLVFATTARTRDMIKTVHTPKKAIEIIHEKSQKGHKTGILFGPERTGLKNEDICRINDIITVPLNPDYTSLNLAQSVLLIAYEWYTKAYAQEVPASQLMARDEHELCTKKELDGLYGHLEGELDKSGFLRHPQLRPTMIKNIRNIFARIPMTSQEVRTLRGIISALAGKS